MTDKLCALERTLSELRNEKEEILKNLVKVTEIDNAINNIEEEISEVKEKKANSMASLVNMCGDKPIFEVIKNNQFSCKIAEDIEDYFVVDFKQDYDNIIIVRVVDFYSFQKNKSLVGILEQIKSDGKLFNVSLDTFTSTGALVNNMVYQECKILGYNFFRTYITEKKDDETIFEIKIKYQKVSHSNYLENTQE